MVQNQINERTSCGYSNASDRFNTGSQINFYNQYFSIYNKRLEQLSSPLKNVIAKVWGKEFETVKLRDLIDVPGKCVIVGTIFKDQVLKPSVLKELAEKEQLVPQPIKQLTDNTSDSDGIYVEDESQRYRLEGNIDREVLVTGVTCAILGSENGKGVFLVEDIRFVGLQNYVDRPVIEHDRYVALISGLDLAHTTNLLPMQMLVQWIGGFLGEIANVKVHQMTRLIIAGNSINIERVGKLNKAQDAQKEIANQVDHVKDLDRLLVELCQMIDVDLMPGEHDPSNYMLPQRPLHRCLFPDAGKYRSLHCVSNPYECELEGVRWLGSAGESVRNIALYTSHKYARPLEILGNCLEWAHLAPTAPDTLACLPQKDNDPFIIERAPHIFFAGGTESSEFDTKMYDIGGKAVRLITVPSFARTGTIAVVNLKNLECFPIQFKIC